MKTTTNQSTPRPVNFATSQKSPKNGPYLLRYSKLSSSEEAVGQIPANGRTSLTEVGSSDIFYTDSFKPNDSMELQGWSRVYHDQPYLKDGKPVFKDEMELIHLGPKSGIKEGLLGGLAGTVAGGIAAAALVGLGVVAAPVGLAAAAVVGAGASIVAATDARKDVRELQWVETPIVSREVEGFRRNVTRSERTDELNHTEVYYTASHRPLVKDTFHGSWMKPVVVDRRA